jgi:MtfA peptidase
MRSLYWKAILKQTIWRIDMRPLIFYLVAMAGAHLVQYRRSRRKKHVELTHASPLPAVDEKDLVIKGSSLALSDEEMNRMLLRRFHYYQELDLTNRERFMQRLGSFIRQKIFIIKDEKGYREMPVLVSASAIQLCFGLKDHTLPFYRYIRIYPSEYISDTGFKILAGNVHGNTITVAWNHVLDGYADSTDGSNLGLHEMSHALYIQKLVIEENYAISFSRKYKKLVAECSKAHADEATGIKDVYSNYALSNLQEFWAESVELFFERPSHLHDHYPEIFIAMKLLLNQNPLHPRHPIIQSGIPVEQRFDKIAGYIKKALASFP